MALLNIQATPLPQPFSIFVLGFRPFFLAAGIFSILVMLAWMQLAAVLDQAFNLLLFLAALIPVIRVRQWKQPGIISRLFLLANCNLLFYLCVSGLLEQAVYWAIYAGLYLMIALILTMGHRVCPAYDAKSSPALQALFQWSCRLMAISRQKPVDKSRLTISIS